MSVEITQYSHPPIPAHLAGVRRFGLALARWANHAAAKRAVRLQKEKERLRSEWERRAELARHERRREQLKAEWYLYHVW
jgi:hypothetical protein